MAGSASMFSGALLGFTAINQGIGIAAAALQMLFAQSTDNHNNVDSSEWYSAYRSQTYESSFVFAASGLTFFLAFILIGCLNRRSISAIPSTFIAAIIMALQVAVGVYYALYLCVAISPIGAHSDTAKTLFNYDYDTYYDIYILGIVTAVLDLGINMPIALGMIYKAISSMSQEKGYPQEITMTAPMN